MCKFIILSTVLEKQVEALDERLKERQTELSVLTSYKDKEYPVRAMKIAELQKQIQYLTAEYEVKVSQDRETCTFIYCQSQW